MDNGVARRGVVAGILLMALLWPAVGNAQEVPTDTTVPVEPPSTVPVVPDVPEDEPPSTTVPAPPAPEPAEEPVIELDTTAPAPEGGPRTLTVLPRRNLVDRQLVTIRGKGWSPHSGAQGFAQCISGTSDTSGCGRVEFVRNDAAGNFRARYRVDVILETSEGTFDCRVEVCVIGSNDTPVASGARFVRLHFDPAGPDPVRRTVTVDPTTDLVDGQEVTVTGDGFGTGRYNRYVEIFQCRLPAAGYDDCDPGTYEFDQADQDGHLDSKAHLEARLRFPDGTTLDCRTGGCALLVRRVRRVLRPRRAGATRLRPLRAARTAAVGQHRPVRRPRRRPDRRRDGGRLASQLLWVPGAVPIEGDQLRAVLVRHPHLRRHRRQRRLRDPGRRQRRVPAIRDTAPGSTAGSPPAPCSSSSRANTRT